MLDLKTLARDSKASQDTFEMWQLLELLQQLEPQVIVEIGIDKGHSMATWKEAFSPEILIGINENMDHFDYKANHFADDVIVADSHLPSTYNELAKRLAGEQIDFLFIDGDHTYNGVRQDYEMYAQLVRPGGVIAFHDTMRVPGQFEGVEVMQLFQELRMVNYSLEFWGGGTSPGTGVIVK